MYFTTPFHLNQNNVFNDDILIINSIIKKF